MVIQYGVLALCILGLCMGQVLLKMSAQSLLRLASPWGLILEPCFMGAVSLYGLTTLAWVWCLQTVPLNRAYLFTALAFVLVPLLGTVIFHEQINKQYLLGAALIVTGVLVSGLA